MNAAWILAVVIGLLTSTFVVDQYLGLSSVILTGLSVYIMYRYKKQSGMYVGKNFYRIAVYMVILSVAMAVTTVSLVRFWAIVILLVLLLALSVCENDYVWPKWLAEAFKTLGGGMSRMGKFFSAGKEMSSNGRRQIAYVALGLLLSVPILAVAAGLLASADDYMEEFLDNLFEGLEFDDAGVWIWRFILFVFVSALAFGYSVWFAREKAVKEIKEPANVEVIPPTVSGTILVLLNCLYLVFAYIQVRFLFFGSANVVAGQYNYAEYARSGFFELVVLAMMNTVGILIINRFTKTHLFNHINLTITVACTFLMIASSWYKMYLYEQEYGYTQLRLYVYLILAFMIVFMALIALGIWQRHYKVVEWAIVIGLCYFLVVSFVNVDKIIVNNNMERYHQTGQLDIHYLMRDLSEDAVPTIIGHVEANPGIFEESGQNIIVEDFWDGRYSKTVDAEYLEREYENMKTRVVNREKDRQFFEFNLRHWLALKASR